MIDHDRLFKELLTVHAWEFIELFMPEVAAYLEKGSLAGEINGQPESVIRMVEGQTQFHCYPCKLLLNVNALFGLLHQLHLEGVSMAFSIECL